MSDRLDYQAFFDLLRTRVAGKGTHTLFGRTDSNHAVIIGLRGGEVVCVTCGAKRGVAAIPALRQMSWGTFRVEDSLVPLQSSGLPPTNEILASLSPFADLDSFKVETKPASAAGSTPNREARTLCSLLSRYLGPVAPMLCAEKITAAGGLHNSDQLDRVLRQLAQEIGSAKEAEEFMTLARGELGALLQLRSPEGAKPMADPPPGRFAGEQAAAALCALVTDYLGPVAPILCEEKIAAVGGLLGRPQLEAVIQNLALEIGEQDEARQFVIQARQRLGLLPL